MTVNEAAQVEGTEVPITAYEGKKVKIAFWPKGVQGEKLEELVGIADVANEMAVLFRPKGKTSAMLIEPEWLVSIGLDDSKPIEIKQKTLKDPNFSTVRQHLADRHGWSLEDINDTDEEAAYKAHLETDHSSLAHTHDFIVDAEEEADGEPSDDDDESDED